MDADADNRYGDWSSCHSLRIGADLKALVPELLHGA
jgi:hypothetical protein